MRTDRDDHPTAFGQLVYQGLWQLLRTGRYDDCIKRSQPGPPVVPIPYAHLNILVAKRLQALGCSFSQGLNNLNRIDGIDEFCQYSSLVAGSRPDFQDFVAPLQV